MQNISVCIRLSTWTAAYPRNKNRDAVILNESSKIYQIIGGGNRHQNLAQHKLGSTQSPDKPSPHPTKICSAATVVGWRMQGSELSGRCPSLLGQGAVQARRRGTMRYDVVLEHLKHPRCTHFLMLCWNSIDFLCGTVHGTTLAAAVAANISHASWKE